MIRRTALKGQEPRFTQDEIVCAIADSAGAAAHLRCRKQQAISHPPSAATEHMPFAGHRTVATVWAQQRAARARDEQLLRERMEYGFDPESLTR